MPTPAPQTPEPAAPLYSPFAGFLSYLVPGLGQICQGRVGKGLLFLVFLYRLFFFGMYLGDWRNVYLPDAAEGNNLWRLSANVFNRPQFAGQFWIGVAAWPALWQYHTFDSRNDAGPVFGRFERAPLDEREINDLQRKGDKNWDLAWVYTVIAGVLNILVIYDAAAGPAFGPSAEETPEPARGAGEANPA
jgi:TM2 domain-containing membrane protein YozV